MRLLDEPELLTERMTIRPLSECDSCELSDAVNETWLDLNKWMQWATNKSEKIDLLNCRKYTSECQKKFAKMDDFTFGCFLKQSSKLVVSIRLAHSVEENNSFEFCGIWCRKQFQNKGYASEAVRALIRYAFVHLKASNLVISHADGNLKSQKLIESLGFKPDFRKEQIILLPSGKKLDALYYSLSSIKKLSR